jgi:hypothetical protein
MTTINQTHLTIDTTSIEPTIGQLVISANRRGNKAKGIEIPKEERIRRVMLPAGHWPELRSTIDNIFSQPLTDILRERMRKLAGERLEELLTAEPLARSVPASLFSLSELLAWSTETSTNRGSIGYSAEDVESWLEEESTIIKALALRTDAKAAALAKDYIEKCTRSASTQAAKAFDSDAVTMRKFASMMQARNEQATVVGAKIVARVTALAVREDNKRSDAIDYDSVEID